MGVAGDDIVLTLSVRMDVRDGAAWVPIRRKQTVVLRVREGRIARVTDYW